MVAACIIKSHPSSSRVRILDLIEYGPELRPGGTRRDRHPSRLKVIHHWASAPKALSMEHLAWGIWHGALSIDHGAWSICRNPLCSWFISEHKPQSMRQIGDGNVVGKILVAVHLTVHVRYLCCTCAVLVPSMSFVPLSPASSRGSRSDDAAITTNRQPPTPAPRLRVCMHVYSLCIRACTLTIHISVTLTIAIAIVHHHLPSPFPSSLPSPCPLQSPAPTAWHWPEGRES